MHAIDEPPPERLTAGDWVWLPKTAMQQLIDALAATHRVIGPQVVDGAVVLADLARVEQLPAGIVDEQDGGRYRLKSDPEAGWFDHVVGPHSLKNFLFPARETIARFSREGGSWRQEEAAAVDERPIAVVGARGCDLEALRVQDRVFLEGGHVDPGYARRRRGLFVIAVNCRRAAATCFCHSMGCGPAATHSFDLALVEEADRFACEIGSEAGAELLARAFVGRDAPLPCSVDEIGRARRVPEELASRMHARETVPGEPRPRSLDTDGIRDLLFGNLEHPRWEDVATRCLSCTNCTLVCPTCFCSSVTEVADLSGDHVERERQWASCFTLDHARIHGGSVRSSTASRYRQWLTHKLAGWIDQFGSSGCTGCGRCITWCPVGIDLTEEVAAIRATDGATSPTPPRPEAGA